MLCDRSLMRYEDETCSDEYVDVLAHGCVLRIERMLIRVDVDGAPVALSSVSVAALWAYRNTRRCSCPFGQEVDCANPWSDYAD